MTAPTPQTEATADDFLATTQEDENGNVTTEYVKIQDVSNELLWHYVTLGDERAAAELASRLEPEETP